MKYVSSRWGLCDQPAALLLALIAVITACLPLVVSEITPMSDLCQHVLVGHILANIDDPSLRFSEHFAVERSFLPTSLAYEVLSLMQRLAGPFGGARLYLVSTVILLYFGAILFARSRGADNPAAVATLALPLAFSWPVYMGFLPFVATFPFFLLTLAWWYRTEPGLVRSSGTAVLLLIMYGFHVVGAAAAALAIVVASAVTHLKQRSAIEDWLTDGVAVIPVAAAVAIFLFLGSGPELTWSWLPIFQAAKSFVFYTVASLHEGATWVLLVFLSLTAAVALMQFRSPAVDLGAIAFGLLAIGLLTPTMLGPLWPAGPRLLPFAFLVGLGAITKATGRTGWLLQIGGTAACVALSALTLSKIESLKGPYNDFLAARPIIEPGKNLLPVLVDPKGGAKYIDPFWSLASAYTIDRGGSNPYVFATPYVATAAVPIRYRFPDRDRTHAFLFSEDVRPAAYRGVSENYDYVLLWGSAPRIEEVLRGEMCPVFRRGELVLFSSREDCPPSEDD